MRFLFGDRDRTVNLLGSELQVNTVKENGYFLGSQLAGLSAVIRDETPVLLNLASLVVYADAFLDIGANIGLYSSILSRIRFLLPNLEIHAFEVDPDTARRLKTNADRYSFTVHQIGIANYAGKATFTHGSVSHLTSSASSTDSGQATRAFEASVVCLDSFPWNYTRLVLKIDVEGSEYEVLAGAERLFAEDRVLAVYLDTGYGRPDEVRAFLAARGFRLVEGHTLECDQGETGILALNERKIGTIRKALFSSTLPYIQSEGHF